MSERHWLAHQGNVIVLLLARIAWRAIGSVLMAVVVDLPAEVEQQVRQEAARAGVDAAQVIRDAVVDRLAQRPGRVARLSRTESELLQKINEGLHPERWERFHALVARRQAETLTPDEHVELIALTNEIEEMNARRIEHLTELAELKGIS